jgi:uncharacterized membrane protein YdfJ with MMPL/SSD domain
VAHREGPYGRLARWVMARPRAVGGAALLLAVITAFLGLPPDIDPNLLELLPARDPSVQALRRLHEEEGGTNLVTLAFESDAPEAMEPFLTALVSDLEALDMVEYALHEVDSDLAFELGLLQLEANDVGELDRRLRGALALGPALNPIVTQRLLDMGPTTERIAQAREMSLFDESEGGSRVLVRPTGSSHDPVFSVALMDSVDAILDERLTAAPEVELLWIGGAYRHNVEDLRGIQQDMGWTSIASLVLVLLVLAAAFRGPKVLLLVFAPLVLANLANLALVRFTVGTLNTYTAFSTAILIGLGIDFAVHLVGRYREYRGAGLAPEDAVAMAWERTGPPCTTAALTSAAGFLALSVAQFQGFSQLGLLLATGLMFCLVFMLVLLPILLPWLDADPPPSRSLAVASGSSRSSYALAPVGVMAAVLLTGIVGATQLPKLSWEYDFSNLRRDGLSYSELSETERELAKESYSPVVYSFDSADALRATRARLGAAKEVGALPHVGRMMSLDDVLPLDQALRVSKLRDLSKRLEDPDLRYLPPPFVAQLLPLRGREYRVITRDQLPPAVLDLLGARDADDHRLLVFPKGNMWDLREASALGAELAAAEPRQVPAGEYVTLGALYNVVRGDMPLVAALALILVTMLTAIDLRNLAHTFAAMGTLLAGLAWAGAAVQGAGIQLSILNITGVPILLGIGVDVVIHLLHRLEEEGPGGVRRALATTGVAASVSTLTTLMSFASLTLAGNRGVRSLGMLVVIGLATVFVAAATLLPLAWSAGWKITGLAPSDREPDPE